MNIATTTIRFQEVLYSGIMMETTKHLEQADSEMKLYP